MDNTHQKGWHWTELSGQTFLEYDEGLTFEDFLHHLLLHKPDNTNPCTGFKNPLN